MRILIQLKPERKRDSNGAWVDVISSRMSFDSDFNSITFEQFASEERNMHALQKIVSEIAEIISRENKRAISSPSGPQKDKETKHHE